jgi:ribose transport system permease protein
MNGASNSPAAAGDGGERQPKLLGHFGTVTRVVVADGWLVSLLIVAFVAFSIALPNTFPTKFNINSILSAKAVVALTAFAVLIPLAANQFDLSVGYVVGLTSILIVGLQAKSGIPWPLAILIVLAIGMLIGFINGVIVACLHVNSFIATLGTGTFIYGLAGWYTDGHQVVGRLPEGFTQIAGTTLGIPTPALIALAFAIVLWLILEYTPLGRHLYVLGASPRAAELTGIPNTRYIIGAFMASGALTAVGGILLGAELQVGQLSTGPEYLLPAFAAALLGATAFGKRRVNIWGAAVAILLLAVIVSGLQQLGAQFYVQPLFNGGILVAAVAIAGIASRRRLGRLQTETRHEAVLGVQEELGEEADAGQGHPSTEPPAGVRD